jgi:hypothetical protein
MVTRVFAVGLLGMAPLLAFLCFGCSPTAATSRSGRSGEGDAAGTPRASPAGPGRQLVFRVKGLTCCAVAGLG